MPAEVKDDRHRSQDLTRRFPQDARLRRWGFRIHARPAGDEPVWRWDRDRELYGQLEALHVTYKLEKEER